MPRPDTEEERAALDLFLAFETQHHDHFTAQVYRLIAKADAVNRRRMSLCFGLEVEMYEEWMETPTPQEFYDKYNVRKWYVPEEHDKPQLKYIDDPIRPELQELMRDIAGILDGAISQHMSNQGFALLIFDLGEGGTMNYISNAQRDDMVKAMQEFIEKQGGR